MIFELTARHVFPDPVLADEDGLVAVGGDLHPDRLLQAYRRGIFPWFNPGDPILWWSPDPRMILYPERFRISKSLSQRLRSGKFRVTFNQAFESVIDHCAAVPRKDQAGTWITPDMKEAYCRLQQDGHAMSVECWAGDSLAGGLYGVCLPAAFCGESMFSLQTDASKVALAALVSHALTEKWHFIDCQLYTAHLERLGAEKISRTEFLRQLKIAVSCLNY
ncbi:MAG TPA: leucyl/phenylalanyl-tRNA--protein transferase [Bacteroidales bacterium]|nr:leucyl/phenylalanyl-tRNA--protein transferase [Bacteroidales bacterium]HSA44570.1 leucyl/phenylalanyl-tRNA--protein transferase [Bacteroidales bacterium]